MTLRSVANVGVYRSGEGSIYIAEHNELASNTKPLILFSPGYGGNAIRVLSYASGGSRTLLRRCATFMPSFSIDAGGTNTFGNDTAVTAIGQAVAHMQTILSHNGPYVLVGTSMGFADLMAYARTNVANIAGAVCSQGLVDLTGAWETPVDLGGGVMSTTKINEAYGGTYSPTTHGPTHDPMMYASELTFPIKMFVSSDDTMTTPTSHEEFAALAPDAETNIVGAYGHTEETQEAVAHHPALVSFLYELQL